MAKMNTTLDPTNYQYTKFDPKGSMYTNIQNLNAPADQTNQAVYDEAMRNPLDSESYKLNEQMAGLNQASTRDAAANDSVWSGVGNVMQARGGMEGYNQEATKADMGRSDAMLKNMADDESSRIKTMEAAPQSIYAGLAPDRAKAEMDRYNRMSENQSALDSYLNKIKGYSANEIGKKIKKKG